MLETDGNTKRWSANTSGTHRWQVRGVVCQHKDEHMRAIISHSMQTGASYRDIYFNTYLTGCIHFRPSFCTKDNVKKTPFYYILEEDIVSVIFLFFCTTAEKLFSVPLIWFFSYICRSMHGDVNRVTAAAALRWRCCYFWLTNSVFRWNIKMNHRRHA